MSVGMKAYASQLAARLPGVAPENEYIAFTRGGNFGYDEQVRLPLAMRGARLDLMHFTTLYVPAIAPVRSVITIHDLIHLRFPQYFKSKVAPYYHTLVRWACARARRVITDDDRTIDDLQHFLGVDRRKVRVVPLGVDERFFAAVAPAAAPRPYVLYVGNHRAHKNLATLFDAWSALPQELGVDLYLTGPDDFGGELQRLRRSDRQVVALGDVSTEALIGYYAGALALALPALAEGFGLPMLEAMAAGCPVIASAQAAPSALSGAALLFAARDSGQLRSRLESIVRDDALRARLSEQGRAVAARLTWDRCARATADIYREVLEES